MAVLRLFANLREIAGTAQADHPGSTVAEVLDAASLEYGDRFASQLAHARVWINGEPAGLDDVVGTGDELALIPPVSGGADIVEARVEIARLAPFGLAALLAIANIADDPVWFVTALVGIAGLWAVDLVSAANSSDVGLRLPPLLATLFIGAIAPYGMAANDMAGAGIALVPVSALVAVFVWAVAASDSRDLDSIAATIMASVVGGLGVASLVLLRISTDGRARVAVFLLIAVLSAIAWWASSRAHVGPMVDPPVAGALMAVAASVFGAWLWDLDLIVFMVVGVAASIAMVAGRGYGAMVRTGEVYLVDYPPGLLTLVDGAVLAAAVFYPALLSVT